MTVVFLENKKEEEYKGKEEDTETLEKADRKEKEESKEKIVYTEKNCVHLSMRKESE